MPIKLGLVPQRWTQSSKQHLGADSKLTIIDFINAPRGIWESGRRHLGAASGEGICDEASGERPLGGCARKDTSGRQHMGEGI